MANHRVQYSGVPKREGLLAITAQINAQQEVSIAVTGDREGLRYLASVLLYLAEIDIDATNLPEGERAHIHLHPGQQLIENCCDVEICRAEAKGTRELPAYFL